MEQTYTDFKLIRFLYKDTDIPEYFETQNMIEEDKDIRSKFKELLASVALLPKVRIFPSHDVTSNILRYSKESLISASN